MRIGIDGRNLTAPFSGIARYLTEMLGALSADGHELIVYVPHALANPPSLTATIRIGTEHGAGAVQRHVWGQITLPRQVAGDQLDVFWGPAHRLPKVVPSRLPRVVTIHDLVWYYFRSTMRPTGWLADRVFMPLAVNTADLVVADSHATATSLEQVLHVPRIKTRVVYPGTTVHPPLKDDVLTLPPNFILFVGTLEPRKNLERLLRAFSELPEGLRRTCPLIIAGAPGWRQRNVSDLASAMGLGDTTRVLGFVSEENLIELYSRCRFVAFPSLYEGFGFPIVEANRLGKPVLTSANSSMIEIAGDTNLLVDPFDTASIASGLQTLMLDEARYAALALGTQANSARFSWDRAARELVATFVEAIEIHRGKLL